MRQITREQQAVQNFQNSFQQLRNITDTKPELCSYIDGFGSSISSFIFSELNFRQYDRCENLKIFNELAKHSLNKGNKNNQIGIEILKLAIEDIKNASNQKDLVNISKPNEQFKTEISNASNRIIEHISYMEIKGSDAKELLEVVNELQNLFINMKSEKEFFSYINSKTELLISTRNSKTRGADTNIALWKLIAAAILLAVGLWVVYKCYYSKWACSKKEKAIYNSVLSVAMIVLGACE